MKIKLFISLFLLNFTFMMDYSLEDKNSTSDTYQEFVGPGYFDGMVSINYMGWEN